jgi:hypothetical protein
MVILALIFLGDFTIRAEPGTWIDYARTGYLSENRYKLVIHQGEKGDYDKGTEHLILDRNGNVLYSVPIAENAWTLSNGIMGDEDTFIYQNRLDPTFYLWHPDHGRKALDMPDKNLGRNGFYFYSVPGNGRTIYFLSRRGLGKKDGETEIEEVELLYDNTQALFEDEGLAIRHTNYYFEHYFDHFRTYNEGFIMFDAATIDGRRPKSFFHFRYSEPSGQKLERKTVKYHFGSILFHSGLLSATTQINGKWYLTLSDQNNNIVMMIDRQDEHSSAVHQEILDLMDAFNGGYSNRWGDNLAYIKDNHRVEVDLEAKTVRKYRLRGRFAQNKGFLTPHADEIIVCNHKMFKVIDLRDEKTKKNSDETPGELVEVLPIPDRYLSVEANPALEH